jgi:hypothetical protein
VRWRGGHWKENSADSEQPLPVTFLQGELS